MSKKMNFVLYPLKVGRLQDLNYRGRGDKMPLRLLES